MLTINHLAQAGDALHRVGRADLAADFWEAAIAASPDDPALLTAAGVTYRAMKRPADAESCLRRAIAIEPSGRRHVILGCSIHDQLRFEECEAEMRRARELDPNAADAAGLLGVWLLERWHWRDTSDDVLSEAIAHIERGIELAPENFTFLSTRLAAMIAADRLDDVIAEATRLIGRYPNVPELHLHRASARMKLGQLTTGHIEFGDWAYKLPRLAAHPFHAYPQWGRDEGIERDEGRGMRDEEGKTGPNRAASSFIPHPSSLIPSKSLIPHPSKDVYVWNIEGAGDHFQFIRFAADMARDGWTVRAICNKTMDRLIARVPGVTNVVTEDAEIPEGAMLARLPSLPAAYVGLVPLWNGPYMSADAATIASWRHRLHLRSHHAPRDADLTRSVRTTSGDSLRVGVAWRGNPEQANDERRSFDFERLAPLLDLPGLSFVSLQKSDQTDRSDRSDRSDRMMKNITDLGDDYEAGDWLDTAGVIANLDLVITPDTAIAHLAGAMGKPVWIALSEPCCWRWGMGRRDEGIERDEGRGMRDEEGKTGPNRAASSFIPHPSSLIPSESLIPHPSEGTPWYPSMRLFRQRVRGSWDGVFEAMATATAIAVSTKSQITNSNYQYTGSRAGVLFGAGTVVDWRDIVAAGA